MYVCLGLLLGGFSFLRSSTAVLWINPVHRSGQEPVDRSIARDLEVIVPRARARRRDVRSARPFRERSAHMRTHIRGARGVGPRRRLPGCPAWRRSQRTWTIGSSLARHADFSHPGCFVCCDDDRETFLCFFSLLSCHWRTFSRKYPSVVRICVHGNAWQLATCI